MQTYMYVCSHLLVCEKKWTSYIAHYQIIFDCSELSSIYSLSNLEGSGRFIFKDIYSPNLLFQQLLLLTISTITLTCYSSNYSYLLFQQLLLVAIPAIALTCYSSNCSYLLFQLLLLVAIPAIALTYYSSNCS